MAYACFTGTCHSLESVRNPPGPKCQGCARSVPQAGYPPPPLIAQTYENTGDGGGVLAQTFENKSLRGAPREDSGTEWGLQEIEKPGVVETRNSLGREEVPNALDLRGLAEMCD